MKFLSAIIFALFFICAVQAQRGFPGGRRPAPGPGPIQGGGPKSDCPTVCPLNYQPTCGFNGRCYKEFSNTCALTAAACLGEGNFRQVPNHECSKRGARTC